MVLRDRNHPSVIIWSIGHPHSPSPKPLLSPLTPHPSPLAPHPSPLTPHPLTLTPTPKQGNEIPIRAEPLGHNLSAQLSAFVR